MLITVPVFQDVNGFYTEGVYRPLVLEQLEMIGYENLSVTVGTYDGNSSNNVVLGQLLANDDPRGKRLLKVYDKLNDNHVWLNLTKEQFASFVDMGITVNVYNNSTVAGGIPPTGALVPQGFINNSGSDSPSTHVKNIGKAGTLIIQKGLDFLTEYKQGYPYDPLDLPTDRKKYKVDKASDMLYFGTEGPWAMEETLFFISEQIFVIP